MTTKRGSAPARDTKSTQAARGYVPSGDELTSAIRSIASAIMPSDSAGGRDETGAYVTSLTEAVMGMTSGLVAIAAALNNVAEAIREAGQPVLIESAGARREVGAQDGTES